MHTLEAFKDVILQVPALTIFAVFSWKIADRVSASLDRNSTVIGRFLEREGLDDPDSHPEPTS